MSKSAADNSGHPSAAVWLVDGSCFSDDDLVFFVERLGASETDRYLRFARKERQRQFLVGRMLLRFAVGNSVALSPSAVRVVERPDDAPQLILPHAGNVHPGFSLSHSGKWVACAASRGTLLGLDIEVMNARRDLMGIGRAIFRPAEAAWFEKQPIESRISAFYRLWSLREALFKLLSNAKDRREIPALVDAGNAIVSQGEGWRSYALCHSDFSCVLCATHDLSLPHPRKPNEISPAALLAAMRQGICTDPEFGI